jgi:predicted transcriptional regulator
MVRRRPSAVTKTEHPPDLIMAIEEDYALQILSGEKRYEMRTRCFRFPRGNRVWLYATKKSRGGSGAILGSFVVGGCERVQGARELRAIAKAAAAPVTKLHDYLHGYSGWAIEVTSYQKLKVPLNKTVLGLRSYRRLTSSSSDRSLHRSLEKAEKYQVKRPKGRPRSAVEAHGDQV